MKRDNMQNDSTPRHVKLGPKRLFLWLTDILGLGETPIRWDHSSGSGCTCSSTRVRLEHYIVGARLTGVNRAVAYVAGLSGSTILYNVVDSPVGVVPVTRVDPDKDFLTSEWTDLSKGEHGSNLLEGLLYTGKKAIYNAEKMADLPVGIQVVGRKWEDEKVIEMMKVVDGALGKRSFGPGSWRKFKDQME